MSEKEAPKVAGEAPPEPSLAPGVFVRVEWARLGWPVKFVCLAERAFGKYLHWIGAASVLCSETEACAWCSLKYPRKWYCWLPGHCMLSGEIILAMIPADSFRRAPALHDGDLVGRIITLERPGKGPTRVRITVSATKSRCVVGVIPAAEMPGYVELAYARMAARKVGS